MKKICEGATTCRDVVNSSVEQYREMFVKASQSSDVLKAVSHNHFFFINFSSPPPPHTNVGSCKSNTGKTELMGVHSVRNAT